ncbi:MAG TPA: hypothetical protein VMG10_37085 [Gemmataceae bacterium]|nr:hypothetical protein [Gemmataceae bacterium]
MQITNQNQTPVPSADNSTSADAAQTSRNDSAAPASSSSSSSFPSFPDSLVPSFELFSLISTLQQVPPVRQDVVAETVRRLSAGDLQSSGAVEQTANAILGM